MLWKRKKPIEVDLDYEYVVSRIRTNVSTMELKITCEEESFIREILRHSAYPRKIRLTKLKDGTFNVATNDEYLGKVRLSGKKKFLQYIGKNGDPEVVYAESAEELVPHISKWFK